MSRKYVGQVNNQNFVYPNQNLVEYDVEIIHDINDKCVIGTIGSFSATTFSSTGITFSHTRTFNMNGAQPFIREVITPLYIVPYLSVHCQVPGQSYMNTWNLVDYESVNTTTPNTIVVTGGTNTFTIVPSQFGLTSFSGGTYSFEFRFIGQNCLYKICSSLTVNIVTPTPTPSPTPTPTSTPTATPSPTPTLTGPTPTPTSTPICTCYYYNAIIGQADLNAATGNTLTFRNNKVYTGYFDCNGNEAFKQYDTAGTYNNDLCPNGVPVNVYYWKDDVATVASVSSVVNTGVCCSVPTPTPTPSPTPTSTPTSTPTITPTPTISIPCVCVELNVTGVTSGPEPVGAGILYNNCYSVEIGEIFMTNGIRYRCMDYTGGIIQEFGYNGMTIGIASGFSCTAGTCPTDIVVTQTSTPTPTPTATSVGPTATPTPTPTGVPPTDTPTPTPTATGVPPTATPTPTSVPFYTYYIGSSNSSALNACSNFDVEPQTEVYASTNSASSVTRFYTDTSLITPYVGSGNWYAWRLGFSGPASNAGQVTSGGLVSNIALCP